MTHAELLADDFKYLALCIVFSAQFIYFEKVGQKTFYVHNLYEDVQVKTFHPSHDDPSLVCSSWLKDSLMPLLRNFTGL